MYGKFEKERKQPSIDLLNKIDGGKFERIIDIGCGSGMSTLTLKKRFTESEIVGVDLSENMLDKARRSISGVTWMQRDCSRKLNDLGTFDLVFSNAFIQWIPNQEEFIKNTKELLNKNGVFAISKNGNNSYVMGAIYKITLTDQSQYQGLASMTCNF